MNYQIVSGDDPYQRSYKHIATLWWFNEELKCFVAHARLG